MKIEWDKEYERVSKTSIYREEIEEIGRFVKSKHQNICFTYEFEDLAKNAYTRLYEMAKQNNIPVEFTRRKNELYVFKKSE